MRNLLPNANVHFKNVSLIDIFLIAFEIYSAQQSMKIRVRAVWFFVRRFPVFLFHSAAFRNGVSN